MADLFLTRYNKWQWIFPFSWVNAWFWISFFLRSEDIIIYIFAWLLAILSKYLFLVRWKHFFNPSNFWVFVSLVIFPYTAWTNPLQWGQSVEIESYIFVLLLIILLWIFILSRLIKILNFQFYDLLWAFILTHLILYFLITQESSISSLYLFFNASFIIFVFFMLTDPKTNPLKRSSKILYWMLVAGLFYVLQFHINENYSILASLFVMTLFLPIIWKLEKEDVSFLDKKIALSTPFLLIFITFVLLYISIMIYHTWKVDLLFDNRCNQIICR